MARGLRDLHTRRRQNDQPPATLQRKHHSVPVIQHFHGPVKEVTGVVKQAQQSAARAEPPDDPTKSTRCPQCGQLTWRHTRLCIHCQLDLMRWRTRERLARLFSAPLRLLRAVGRVRVQRSTLWPPWLWTRHLASGGNGPKKTLGAQGASEWLRGARRVHVWGLGLPVPPGDIAIRPLKGVARSANGICFEVLRGTRRREREADAGSVTSHF